MFTINDVKEKKVRYNPLNNSEKMKIKKLSSRHFTKTYLKSMLLLLFLLKEAQFTFCFTIKNLKMKNNILIS